MADTMAAGAWQDGPAPKDGSWILGLFYGLPYVVCYDSWEISEEGGPKETEEGWCLAGQDMHPMDQDEPEKWARIIHPNRHMPASWDGPGDQRNDQKQRTVVVAGNREKAQAASHHVALAGARGEAVAGAYGIAMAGYKGSAIVGDYGYAKVGARGVALAGDWGIATAGDCGKAAAGNYGVATAGAWGRAAAGDGGMATADFKGTANVGKGGIAQAGEHGIAQAGEGGTLLLSRWDLAVECHRLAVGHIGEAGLLPDTPYQLNAQGEFVEVTGQPEEEPQP